LSFGHRLAYGKDLPYPAKGMSIETNPLNTGG
jgi:hypothetical protein